MGAISYTCNCAGDVLTKPSDRARHGGYARAVHAGESYPIAGASSRSKPNARDLVYIKFSVFIFVFSLFYVIYVSCIHYTYAFMPLGTSCWIHPSCKSSPCTLKSCSSHLCVWSAEVLFPFWLAAYLVLVRFSAGHVTYLEFSMVLQSCTLKLPSYWWSSLR